VAPRSPEAIIASLIIIVLVTVAFGVMFGAFLAISFAIRTDDRRKGSLRSVAPDHSTRAARTLVGLSSSRWD
jgi:hypothetical protein